MMHGRKNIKKSLQFSQGMNTDNTLTLLSNVIRRML